MALEFDADFDGYFDDSYGHGVSATYTPSGGSTKDVSSASHGDTLAFSAQTDLDGNTLKGAKTYSVVNVQPDNTGITALILQEQ